MSETDPLPDHSTMCMWKGCQEESFKQPKAGRCTSRKMFEIQLQLKPSICHPNTGIAITPVDKYQFISWHFKFFSFLSTSDIVSILFFL